MARRYINLKPGEGKPPYSDAVLVDDTLYIAGCIGFIPGSYRVPDDPQVEARNLLDWVKEVLAAAEMSMADLAAATIYCPDLSLFETFNGVYRQYFGADLPARAFIGSGPLLHGGRFQFQGIAQRQAAAQDISAGTKSCGHAIGVKTLTS